MSHPWISPVVAACLLSAPALSADKPRPALKPDLSGTWKSGCETLSLSQGEKMTLVRTFTNTAKEWALDFVVYEDATCAKPFFTARSSGLYSLGKASAKVPGATEIEFSITSRKLTPHSADAAQFLSLACGGLDWDVGTSHDALKSGCHGLGMPASNQCQAESDLVKRDGKALYLGQRPANGEVCSPDRRPTALVKTPLTRF